MPISAFQFWLFVLAYLLAMVVPIIGIRSISKKIIIKTVHNRFEIVSAIVIYTVLFISWNYVTEWLDNIFGKGLISLYASLAFIVALSLYILIMVRSEVLKRI